MSEPNIQITEHVATIVAAYVSRNDIAVDALPALCKSLYSTMSSLSAGTTVASSVVEKTPKTPAAPIKKSVFDDHIICLEDGKKMKLLKGYIARKYHLTPEQYRAKWGLSDDYPMTAPSVTAYKTAAAKIIFGAEAKAKRKKTVARSRKTA